MGNPILRLIILFAFFLSLSGPVDRRVAGCGCVSPVWARRQGQRVLITAWASAPSSSVYVLLVAARFRRTVSPGGYRHLPSAALILTINYGVGLIAYGICGLAHVLVGTSLNTFVQASVPDEIPDEPSFYLLGIMLGFPVGALLIGRVGDAVGFREVMVFNAIVFTVLTFWLTTSGATQRSTTTSSWRPCANAPSAGPRSPL
jgi:hypothetical protein